MIILELNMRVRSDEEVMIRLFKPSPAQIRHFLDEQGRLGLTYPAIGSTASTLPSTYVVDHTRIRLGEGESTFEMARAALCRWEQFQLGWLLAAPADTPIKEGQVVAILGHSLGIWWVNACRIVYTVDRDGPIRSFGFAYGTLPGHAGTGEERFLIELDREDGSVWYDVLAFSRPNRLLARLGYPWMRRLQKRFGRESATAMRRAVGCAVRLK